MSGPELDHYEKVYYSKQAEECGHTNRESLLAQSRWAARRLQEMLGPILPADQDITCVDLGCGSGKFMYFLRERGYKTVIGFDLDPVQVALAQSVGLEAREGEALDSLCKVSSVGLISALDLLEHLDKNRAVMLLQEAYRALAEGGVLIVTCPCADGFFGAHDLCNDLTHKWAATSGMLGQLLRTVGFQDVRILDPSLPPFPLAWTGRLKNVVRKTSRMMFGILAKMLGIPVPRVWAPSQYAVGWRGPSA